VFPPMIDAIGRHGPHVALSRGRMHRHTARGVQKGRRRPQAARPAGRPPPQGVEGYGRAGPGETLRSPWPPIAICPWEDIRAS
jgi:hypothetical protein